MSRRGSRRPKTRLLPPGIADTCAYCGTMVFIETATVDHVVPLGRGGQHVRSNLVWACERCNNRKGDHLICEMQIEGSAKFAGVLKKMLRRGIPFAQLKARLAIHEIRLGPLLLAEAYRRALPRINTEFLPQDWPDA